jgi:hypothetical protein
VDGITVTAVITMRYRPIPGAAIIINGTLAIASILM